MRDGVLKVPLPNDDIFNSNMDWIHSLMLNTTRQNFLRRIEKLDNVVLLSPHRVPFMDRFLGTFSPRLVRSSRLIFDSDLFLWPVLVSVFLVLDCSIIKVVILLLIWILIS